MVIFKDVAKFYTFQGYFTLHEISSSNFPLYIRIQAIRRIQVNLKHKIMKIFSKLASGKYKTLRNLHAYDIIILHVWKLYQPKLYFISLLWLPSFSQLYCIIQISQNFYTNILRPLNTHIFHKFSDYIQL